MRIFGMVTTRDSIQYTGHALASFFRTTPFLPSDQFFLIDNDQNSYQLPDELTGVVQLIRNPTPKGFAANANQMVQRAVDHKADLYFLNNDVIFSRRWIEPLSVADKAILSPLSNREVQYASAISVVKTLSVVGTMILKMPPMTLEEYLGHEMMYEAIVEAHMRQHPGYFNQVCLPFFAVKLPLQAMETVGLFDESFGTGGGEDYDYCLRAQLAGIDVSFAVGSYLLHFGGKSTWEGAEASKDQQARQDRFRRRFEEKWGTQLFDLILNEDIKVLDAIGGPQPDREPREIVRQLIGDKQIQIKL